MKTEIRYRWLWVTASLHRFLFPDELVNRHNNPFPVRCDCGWVGRRRDCRHAWKYGRGGEVEEPVDKCPNCNDEL